jgi:hypothetical protein
MKTLFEDFRIQLCMVTLTAMLVSMHAWAGPAGPGGETPSATRANPSSMARKGAGAPRVAADKLKVYGKTYGEWAADWVQWAEAGPVGQNAVTDTTGEFCDENQPKKDVWFLAGTFGAIDVERDCTIPQDRALFYPLVEGPWIDCPGTPDEDLSDADVRGILAGIIDTACQLTSTLDGVAISSLRVLTVRAQSPKFRSILPDNPVIAEACIPPSGLGPLVGGETGRRIVDGYWVMLPPLSPGPHTLTLHGALCGRDFENGVTYNLTVPEKK